MRYFIYCRKSTEAEDRQIASIESQLTTLKRTFGDRRDIEVLHVYEEAFSAKAPGRPVFDEMMTQIEKCAADGIVAWAPDRLARNSIDGGRIIYLLDRGIIKDLKFATYTFENNSQGKFMLQIMFGQSKYYSDALSDNVKRGNRTKLEHGWRPNQAPLGYLNDPGTRTIIKDPIHFPLIRKMFDLMLTGAYSPRSIAITARNDWGFLTPKRKRIGGVPLAMSTVYKIFSNPFYAGIIQWDGQVYSGKHEPVVSVGEFETVRKLLERPGRPKSQKHAFAFTGMIRCGRCSLMVTAEHKVNRYGSRYIYYHCSKRALGNRCPEGSVELHSLERQISRFLTSLQVDPVIEKWVLQEAARDTQLARDQEQARQRSCRNAAAEIEQQLAELTSLRIRKMISDAEFMERRSALQQEQLRLQQKTDMSGKDEQAWFEPFGDLISFSSRAAEWFVRGGNIEKRLILDTVGSNLILTNQILNITAKKPFSSGARFRSRPCLLGVINDVRISEAEKKALVRAIIQQFRQGLDGPECVGLIDNIRRLREHFEPATVAAEKIAKARRAKGVSRVYTDSRDDASSPSLPLS